MAATESTGCRHSPAAQRVRHREYRVSVSSLLNLLRFPLGGTMVVIVQALLAEPREVGAVATSLGCLPILL